MKNKLPNQIEALRGVRKSWGDMNPVSRVIQDKTKYKRKEKFNRNDE
jgi:hypothetical protein